MLDTEIKLKECRRPPMDGHLNPGAAWDSLPMVHFAHEIRSDDLDILNSAYEAARLAFNAERGRYYSELADAVRRNVTTGEAAEVKPLDGAIYWRAVESLQKLAKWVHSKAWNANRDMQADARVEDEIADRLENAAPDLSLCKSSREKARDLRARALAISAVAGDAHNWAGLCAEELRNKPQPPPPPPPPRQPRQRPLFSEQYLAAQRQLREEEAGRPAKEAAKREAERQALAADVAAAAAAIEEASQAPAKVKTSKPKPKATGKPKAKATASKKPRGKKSTAKQ